ncbi:MAG: hypothetical protein WD314_09085, partial [Trueperaceae bacterium]
LGSRTGKEQPATNILTERDARVHRVPGTVPFRKGTPSAAVDGNMENAVQHLHIVQLDVAPLHRQQVFDHLKLLLGKLYEAS